MSFLSPEYGLVCDNVVNFEVVLADASIVNANASSNTDLYWALKGGGNQFGKSDTLTFEASYSSILRYCDEVYNENTCRWPGKSHLYLW